MNQEPNKWTTFVANRVVEIQRDQELKWNRVATHENPADVASRGLKPSFLESNELWWYRPEWFISGQMMPALFRAQEILEERKKSASATQVFKVEATPEKVSKAHIVLSIQS